MSKIIPMDLEKEQKQQEKSHVREETISKWLSSYIGETLSIHEDVTHQILTEFTITFLSADKKDLDLDYILSFRIGDNAETRNLKDSEALIKKLKYLQQRARDAKLVQESLEFMLHTDEEILDILRKSRQNKIIAQLVAEKISLYRKAPVPFILEAESLEKELRQVLREWCCTKKECKEIFKQGLSLYIYAFELNRNDISYDVYGYDEKRNIWIGVRGQLEIVPSSYGISSALSLIFGIFPTPFSNFESLLLHALIRDIETKASEKGRIIFKRTLGQGIYSLKDHWIIVSGKKAISIHKENLEQQALKSPLFEDHFINMCDEEWIDLTNLSFDHSDKENSLKDTFLQLQKIVAMWEWENPEVVPYLTSALMLALFQHAMHWRPILYLSGARGTGKTLFSFFISDLFSGFCEVVNKTTAHAIKQTFGDNTRIGFLDELEHHSSEKHITDVLNLLKTSCRGGYSSFGTTSKHARKCYLNHMFFLASISFPKCMESDLAIKERIIPFKLKKKDHKNIYLPSAKELKDLGIEIIETMIQNWPSIEEKVEMIRHPDFMKAQMKNFNVSAREIENFTWISAILSLVNDIPLKELRVVPEWIDKHESSDIDAILYHILMKKVKDSLISDHVYLIKEHLLKGKKASLPLEDVKNAKEELRKNYMAVFKDKKDKLFLAIQSKQAGFLLKGLPMFAGMDIKTILGRNEAIKTDKARFGEIVAHSILIPMQMIDKIFKDFK